MKGVVFGKGYMGTRIAQAYGYTLPTMDVLDASKVAAYLDETKPAVVINAVGKTGRPNIDWCETHRPETLLSNVAAPIILASLCAARGIHFVHLSSGCIYQGDNHGNGYAEDDTPNHHNSFYSHTKILAEDALKGLPCLQVRIRMPIDDRPDPRNLIDKIKGYPKLVDAKNSMTVVPDLLQALQKLIEKKRTGIYNIVNPGLISPFEVMRLYKLTVDGSVKFDAISVAELDELVTAKRSNCHLSTAKLAAEGIVMKDIRESVRSCLIEYGRNAR